MDERKTFSYRYRWHRTNDGLGPFTAGVIAFVCWLRFGE
jgi:hypothetical protein